MKKPKEPKNFKSGDIVFECSSFLHDRGVWIHTKGDHLYFSRREVGQLQRFFTKAAAYLDTQKTKRR